MFLAGSPGFPFCPPPTATDLKPDFLDRPPLEIRQRDDDDLAAGLRLHVVDDRRDGGRLVRRNDVREVVDVADRRGKLEPLRLGAPLGHRYQRGENEERERADVHGRRLSRSFPGWKRPGTSGAQHSDWRVSRPHIDSRTTMSYRSVGSFRRLAVELAAAVLLVAACSRGDAAGSSGKSAAAPASDGGLGGAGRHQRAGFDQPASRPRPHPRRLERESLARDGQRLSVPYCKQWHDSSFAIIVQKYVKTGRVRMAYLNMPLSIHQFAMPAAEAAMCASVQDKFWPMHDSLFATQRIWETLQSPASFFDTLANHNHVDMGPWRTCVSQHLTRPLIEADYDRARQTGVPRRRRSSSAPRSWRARMPTWPARSTRRSPRKASSLTALLATACAFRSSSDIARWRRSRAARRSSRPTAIRRSCARCARDAASGRATADGARAS